MPLQISQSPSQPKPLSRFETTKRALLGTARQDFELFGAMASHVRWLLVHGAMGAVGGPEERVSFQLRSKQQGSGGGRRAAQLYFTMQEHTRHRPAKKGFAVPRQLPLCTCTLALNHSLSRFIPEENHCQIFSGDLKLNFLCKKRQPPH